MKALIFCMLLFCGSSCLADSSLPEIKVKIGGQTLVVEVAAKRKHREKGLMERESLPQQRGMLFVFPKEQLRYFWMKNTYIPLSIGFFDRERRLVDIQQMKPMKSPLETEIPRYKSRKPAQYALEVNQGFFKKHNIKLGAQIEFLAPLPKAEPDN